MRLDFAGGNVQYRTVWHLGTIIMMCGVFNGGSQGRHTTSSSPDSKSLQPCPGIYCNIQGSLSLCPCGDGELFGDEKRRHWLLQPSCVWYLLLLNACKALPCNNDDSTPRILKALRYKVQGHAKHQGQNSISVVSPKRYTSQNSRYN